MSVQNLLSGKYAAMHVHTLPKVTNFFARTSDWKSVAPILCAEFVDSATYSAAFASVVVAKNNARTVIVSGSLNAYRPTAPSIFRQVAAQLQLDGDKAEFVGLLQSYYSRLAFSTALSESVALDWPVAHPRHIGWAELADVWKSSCSAGLIAIHKSFDLPTLSDVDVRRGLIEVHELLLRVKAGDAPCVRGDGRLILPGKMDERREQRIKIGARVRISSAGLNAFATLQDISSSGMGLAFAPPLTVGAHVTATQSDGRQLSGRVVWSERDRAGIRFEHPLPPTDPLLNLINSEPFA